MLTTALQLPWRHRRPGVAEDGLQAFVRVYLQELRDTCGELAPILNARQHRLCNSPLAQRIAQQIGRGDGILNREVDADTSHRRHSVRRIADAQQSRPMPLPQPVDLHRQAV